MERDKVFMAVLFAMIIFLTVTLFLGITGKEQVSQGNWSVTLGNVSPSFRQSMYVDPYGTFYTVAGTSVYAIGGDGSMKWELQIKSDWLSNYTSYYLSLADHQGDILYVVVAPEPTIRWDERSLLLAISDNGTMLWEAPVDGLYNMKISISGEHIYLYYYPETISVYNMQGKLLWSKKNVYSPYATGPDGMLYVTNSNDPYEINKLQPDPTILEAHYPNGSLYWSLNFSNLGSDIVQSYFTRGVCQLLYHDRTIYILGSHEVIAIGEDGTLKWVKEFPQQMIEYVGFDNSGRLYLRSYGFDDDTENAIVVTPDGEESISKLKGQYYHNFSLEGFSEGIGYYVTKYYPEKNKDGLQNFTMRAYDMTEGDLLWSYNISPVHVRRTTLDRSNIADILFAWGDLAETRQVNEILPWVWYDSKGLPYGWHDIKGQFLTNLATSGQTVYFSYWAYSYEYPAFYNMSNCTYAGGLYAIDMNGKLLWYKDTDSYITSMTARNGTVYYQVNGGRFGATGADIAAGFAAAAVYLFFRFLVLGAVSRARSRLDKNANRNTVLAFVAENPGASLYEITRALGMNVGTVRYHLLILSINHRISPAGNGRKSVGYFTCSRLYSDEEKLLMPLMRRGQIRELLNILSSQPGLSNAEIAAETGLAESAVSRYMIELNRRGIVAKKRSENGKHAYCIEERFNPALSGFFSGSSIDYSGRQPVQEMPLAEVSR